MSNYYRDFGYDRDQKTVLSFLRTVDRNNARVRRCSDLGHYDQQPHPDHRYCPRVRPVSKAAKGRAYEAGSKLADFTGKQRPSTIEELRALVS